MIDFDRLFHTGVRVPDLDKAMAELGGTLGLTWATPVEWQQPVWTPEAGAHTFPLRFTYSCEGPMHVELLDGAPGSPWDAGATPGAHHLGVWVDDVPAERPCQVREGNWVRPAEEPQGDRRPEPRAGGQGYDGLAVNVTDVVLDRLRV